jgi:hypothetical protein
MFQKFPSLRKILAAKNPDVRYASGYEMVRRAHPTTLSFLCGLCAFAGDIPILLVAALPRWVLRSEFFLCVPSASLRTCLSG